MDILDRASALEMKQTQLSINHHQQANKNKLVISAEDCVDCGEVIPPARRLAVLGCQLCVNCQGLAEQGKR